MKTIRLKKKGLQSVIRRHPWVFSGAVDGVEGAVEPGDIVSVNGPGGEFIAWGHYSSSRISIRLMEFNEKTIVDDAWWRLRIKEAIGRRGDLAKEGGLSAYRLIFSESDALPGLIADWYNGYAVIQVLTPGIDRIKDRLADIIMEETGAVGVVERSDADVRRLEGLESVSGVLRGTPPPEDLTIDESGYRFKVNLMEGQKTGFFVDQRDNRRIISKWAAGRDVLDCFSHTAAFSVYAAGADAASVTRVESSREAALLGDENLKMNGFGGVPGESIVDDAFKTLRRFRDCGRMFDLIILDPPKFAPTKAQVEKASRAYKDVNLLAFKMLKPGGLLATFSCSGGVDPMLFQKIVFGAALDAGREAQIVGWMHQGSDHPVRLSFPESLYLKGLICRATA